MAYFTILIEFHKKVIKNKKFLSYLHHCQNNLKFLYLKLITKTEEMYIYRVQNLN